MNRILSQRLILRVVALIVLISCLIMISRNDSDARLAFTEWQRPTQTQPPVLTSENKVEAPLVLSLLRSVAVDAQGGEIAFSVTNVSSKAIRAYLIRENVQAGGATNSTSTLVNLDLSNRELRPNDSSNEFSTYRTLSDKQHRVTLSVEYVEFLDGTNWGLDTAKAAELTAGQRAGAYTISVRLTKVLRPSSPNDTTSTIDAVAANIVAPADRSVEWREGFRLGCKSVADRLKRAQGKGGWLQLDSELHQLTERLNGAQ